MKDLLASTVLLSKPDILYPMWNLKFCSHCRVVIVDNCLYTLTSGEERTTYTHKTCKEKFIENNPNWEEV